MGTILMLSRLHGPAEDQVLESYDDSRTSVVFVRGDDGEWVAITRHEMAAGYREQAWRITGDITVSLDFAIKSAEMET